MEQYIRRGIYQRFIEAFFPGESIWIRRVVNSNKPHDEYDHWHKRTTRNWLRVARIIVWGIATKHVVGFSIRYNAACGHGIWELSIEMSGIARDID